MTEKIKLTIPNDNKNITLIRMATAFVASQMDFDIDSIEDIRVCVSEACNFQLGMSEKLKLTLKDMGDYLDIRVDKKDLIENQSDGIDQQLACSIMEILMDKVEIDEKGVHLMKYKKA